MLHKSPALRSLLNIPVEAGKCRLPARTDAPADVPLLKPWITLAKWTTRACPRLTAKKGGADTKCQQSMSYRKAADA